MNSRPPTEGPTQSIQSNAPRYSAQRVAKYILTTAAIALGSVVITLAATKRVARPRTG